MYVCVCVCVCVCLVSAVGSGPAVSLCLCEYVTCILMHTSHTFSSVRLMRIKLLSAQSVMYLLGVDRLSAWPIIGADIEHFTDYRYRPFSKQICR